MKRVIIESPYGSKDDDIVKRNEIYGEFCMRDCMVNHNESPYASHLLYTRKYALDDRKPEQRKLGIEAGFEWRNASDKTIFYTDLGISEGMKLGILNCKDKRIIFDYRILSDDLWKEFIEACENEGLEIPERRI